MWTNYLKIALRRLLREKGYAVINISGLAIGLAAVFLIGLWMQDELSYDDFHEKADRAYRLVLHATESAEDDAWSMTAVPAPLASTLEENYPAVEQAVRVGKQSFSTPTIRRGEQLFFEENLLYADAGFFEIFSFPLLEGRAGQVLREPHSVVLTRSAAERYFPGEEALGQSLEINDQLHRVTGIAENLPANTHFDFEVVVSSRGARWHGSSSWGINQALTYVALAEGADAQALQQLFSTLIAERKDASRRDKYHLYLQPLTGIHLGTGVAAGVDLSDPVPIAFGGTGDMLYVYLFGALALFVLLLACVNFINLTTARSTRRAQEIGMRKALGARRGQLTGQILTESVLTAFLALIFALGLTRLALPYVNDLAGKPLQMGSLLTEGNSFWLIGITLLTGLLAGSYPALILSRFAPTRVLRGVFVSSASGVALRRGLVIFQFAVSVGLMASTAVVYQQLGYLQQKNLGFDQEQVILLEHVGKALDGQWSAFKKELTGNPAVVSASYAFSVPGQFFSSTNYRSVDEPNRSRRLFRTWADVDYAETLGLRVKRGRSFSSERASDSLAVLINQEAAHLFFPNADPIGKRLATTSGSRGYKVIGVVENLHFQSLRRAVEPMAILPLDIPWSSPAETYRTMAVRIQSGNPQSALDQIQGTWEVFAPGAPLSYSFLDRQLDAQYRAEERMASVFGVFAAVAVVIACLGLFGLATYMAARRTKEISIRKVLGASAAGIVALLSKEFLMLVGIAVLIGAPAAYVSMRYWLGAFAYHIEPGPIVFLLVGSIAIFVALVTVSYQSVKAALTDPAESLRYE